MFSFWDSGYTDVVKSVYRKHDILGWIIEWIFLVEYSPIPIAKVIIKYILELHKRQDVASYVPLLLNLFKNKRASYTLCFPQNY